MSVEGGIFYCVLTHRNSIPSKHSGWSNPLLLTACPAVETDFYLKNLYHSNKNRTFAPELTAIA